jgi:hypothetical protein
VFYKPALSTIISATSWADLNRKSSDLMTLPASAAVNTTSPDLHVVFAPSGNDPNSFSVYIGNLVCAKASTICSYIFFYAHFFNILLI